MTENGGNKVSPHVEAAGHKQHKPKWFDLLFIISEIIVIFIYAFCTQLETRRDEIFIGAHSMVMHNAVANQTKVHLGEAEKVGHYYGIFQDVHVMIYVGFGFLLAFLKEHSWTSLGYNYIIAAWCSQITILIAAFWHQVINKGAFEKIGVDIPALILGDFGAAVVLVSFGAILGKCNLVQLWLFGTMEVIFYTMNEALCLGLLGGCDMGGCIVVHTFGAYFGLAACAFFQKADACADSKKENSKAAGSYTSQIVGMVGTLFLFIYWPSYNCALAQQYQMHRVIFNTMMAITGSVISCAAVCRLHTGRINMEVLMNATLAGGVAIGSSSSLIVGPAAAMTIGVIAGIVSALGFLHLHHILSSKCGLFDTCGVHNLHGMPGVVGGISGIFAVLFCEASFTDADGKVDWASLGNAIPAMDKGNADPRTAGQQAMYQLAVLGTTLGIAIVSGAFTGFVVSKLGHVEKVFEDEEHWDEVDTDAKEGGECTSREMTNLNDKA